MVFVQGFRHPFQDKNFQCANKNERERVRKSRWLHGGAVIALHPVGRRVKLRGQISEKLRSLFMALRQPRVTNVSKIPLSKKEFWNQFFPCPILKFGLQCILCYTVHLFKFLPKVKIWCIIYTFLYAVI